jgi:hypothetical protein
MDGCWGLFVAGLVLLAATAPGCSDEGAGTISSTPKSVPEVGQVAAPKKGGAVPRVPRGPDQVKALQEATAK